MDPIHEDLLLLQRGACDEALVVLSNNDYSEGENAGTTDAKADMCVAFAVPIHSTEREQKESG